jgi:hypothetical protein
MSLSLSLNAPFKIDQGLLRMPTLTIMIFHLRLRRSTKAG